MSSVSSPSNASDESPSLRVSLAQGEHESVVAALDDAMAKLNVAAGSADAGANAPAVETAALFQLIESMSASSSRREAAMKLVEYLASQWSGASVRCGLGKGRLTQLFDSRLGWLGPESSLHQKDSADWDSPRRRSDDPPLDEPSIISKDDLVLVCLPQPDGTGRCIIRIEGGSPLGDTVASLRLVVATLRTVLWSRPRRSWPSLVVRMARQTSMTIAVAGLGLLALAVWPVHYRVACTARVETTQQRLVATPFEATLLQSNVKPGDFVSAGDVLLSLDGRPLRLEREAIEAEMQQVAKEHDVALATHHIADAQQAAFKQQQLARQYELLSDRLGRLEVTSPIDGVVVSGDLERFIGSPLERGQTLIEVAPMDKMVIEVEIPEHEIHYVSQGADTRVKLDAIGGKSIRMPLSEVYPSAEIRDDRNVFIGRIEVENVDDRLRPGMRGEATTYGPLRPWIWSWVRGGIERVLWWIGY